MEYPNLVQDYIDELGYNPRGRGYVARDLEAHLWFVSVNEYFNHTPADEIDPEDWKMIVTFALDIEQLRPSVINIYNALADWLLLDEVLWFERQISFFGDMDDFSNVLRDEFRRMKGYRGFPGGRDRLDAQDGENDEDEQRVVPAAAAAAAGAGAGGRAVYQREFDEFNGEAVELIG